MMKLTVSTVQNSTEKQAIEIRTEAGKSNSTPVRPVSVTAAAASLPTRPCPTCGSAPAASSGMRGSRGSLKSGISKPVRSLYAVSEVHATNGMEQSAYIGMYAACILALGIACVNATALVNSWSTFAHLVRRLIG